MKKIVLIISFLAVSFLLVSCGNSEGPLTEAQQAEKYGLSLEEFKEQKDAAARMNMTIEDHLKMGHGDDSMDHSDMDMMDDSMMIEDDAEMSNMHTMEDGTMMDDSIEMSSTGTHTMKDGTVMTDEEHMEMYHKDEDVEMHGAEEHR